MVYKLRNAIIGFLLILVAFLLQCSVFSRLTFIDCSPNLLLIITFAAGYTRGKTPGMLLGFFSGLLMDVFYCDVLGYNAVILLIIGFVSGMLNKYFYSEHIYVPLFFIVCFDLIICLCYYVFFYAARGQFSFGYYFLHVILPGFLLTFIAALLAYLPLAKLNERLAVEL